MNVTTKNDDKLQEPSASLLESILFLMTPEQREYFLNSSSSNSVIYANKNPSFNYQLTLSLSWKANNNLLELLNDILDPQLPPQKNTLTCMKILKKDLERGVRFSGPPVGWYNNNKEDEDIPIHIQSRRFSVQCRLKVFHGDKAILGATYIKSASDTGSVAASTDDEDYELSEMPEFEEPVNIDICSADASVKSVVIASNDKPFYPHVTTTWQIYPSNWSDVEYFDAKAIKQLVWQIDNNRLSSKVYYWARKHLKELADVVNLTQLAMQYRYTIAEETENTDGRRSYKLKVRGFEDDVAKIKHAYVYAENNEIDYSSANAYDSIVRLLKRRIRKPVILERKGCDHQFHIFDVIEGTEIPHEGFIVDVGLESQIKKQIEAMHYLAVPQSILHLIKLATLIGKVEVSRLESFSWDQNLELFDKQLTGRQCEAVAKALSTPDICLIQGPPGTGKTRVISEIIQQASAKSLKTLLVAPTHIAVDNVLENIGAKDNVSPVRCANKDRLEMLPEDIRQFTYEKRKESLVVHSQNKVRDDIKRLDRERKNIEDAVANLQTIISLHDETESLKIQEGHLKNHLLFSIEKDVEKEFEDERRNSHKNLIEKEGLVCDANKHLCIAYKSLESLGNRITMFASGVYSIDDKTQFELARSNVDSIYGKTLRNIETQVDKTEILIHSIKIQIKKANDKLQATNEILGQLNEGKTPENILRDIKKAVSAASAIQNRIIAKKSTDLTVVYDKLDENEKLAAGFMGMLKITRQKKAKLACDRLKPWWYKTISLTWWESKFINFEFKESFYDNNLKKCISLKLSLEQEINRCNELLEKAKSTKISVLENTRISEFQKQKQLYQSRYEDLHKEQNIQEKQLLEEESNLKKLTQQMLSARQCLERELENAAESTKAQIGQQVASEMKAAIVNIPYCMRKIGQAEKELFGAQCNHDKLKHRIKETICQKRTQLESEIKAIRDRINANADTMECLHDRVVLVTGQVPIQSASQIQKVIEILIGQIDKNKTLSDFLEDWLSCLRRNGDDLSLRLAKYINLVCATTIGIASDEYFGDDRPFEQKQFDLLVIDEAGKVTEAEFLVAASRAKRWVIVGDHKQLPPYYDRKLDTIFSKVNTLRRVNKLPSLDPDMLKTSYFENLWNQLYAGEPKNASKAKARFVTLDIQRRMHPDLAMFISDMFYKNEYHSPDDLEYLREKTLDLPRFQYPVTFIEVISKGKRGLETNLIKASEQEALKISCKTGYANLKEAENVIEVLHSLFDEQSIFAEQKELIKKKDSAAVIGIMAFYAGQVELIRKLIKEDKSFRAQELSAGQFICKEKLKVIVNTVDSFQGKECSVVILSFTRSNPYKNIGFVDDANRLNVAMSRARKKLILLGDTETFIKRLSISDKHIAGDSSDSICKERIFFTKLVQYIEGHGEIKKAFHVRREDK